MAVHGVAAHHTGTVDSVVTATDTAASAENPEPADPHQSGHDEQKNLSDDGVEAGAVELSDAPRARTPRRFARFAVGFGLIALVTLSALVGWLGVETYQGMREQDQRDQFLAAGRAGAISLTTINPDNAEAEAAKILETSVGPFHQDFEQRSAAFVETVKRVQSRTEGTVVEAGLESVAGDHADVLVAISVKTSLAGTEAPARLWRMRISVQRVGPTEKVSNVQYVP